MKINIIFAYNLNNKSMKTNVTMESKDRELFGVTIRQDTKNQFLSVTDLQEAYTRARIQKGWNEKRIENILSNMESSERIYYILEKQCIIKTGFPAFMKEVKNTSLVKVMKKYGVYKNVGARSNRHVSCNPYIWVLLALELNPEIYATVVMWLTDNLIINRIEAGDKYNDLCRSASKFNDVDYRTIAKGLNYIVFNIHETMIRNKANQEQLKELDDLQKSLAFAIDMGYIASFPSLVSEMRKLYCKKWGK